VWYFQIYESATDFFTNHLCHNRQHLILVVIVTSSFFSWLSDITTTLFGKYIFWPVWFLNYDIYRWCSRPYNPKTVLSFSYNVSNVWRSTGCIYYKRTINLFFVVFFGLLSPWHRLPRSFYCTPTTRELHSQRVWELICQLGKSSNLKCNPVIIICKDG
jgi:hypothetical protein